MLDCSPPELTPEERLHRLAAILARGVRRYHQTQKRQHPSLRGNSSEKLSKSSPAGLEVPETTVLSVSRRFGV